MAVGVSAPAKRLLDVIGSKEAPAGYDTVYNNQMRRMPKRLSTMTIQEAITQGQWRYEQFGSSACGRYQFMKKTLQDMLRRRSLGLTGREVLSPAMQDRLGFALLQDRGYADFIEGTKSVRAFGLALAQEWASFPVLADTQGQHRAVRRGESYYAGDAQNHSLITPAEVERVLAEVYAMAQASLVALVEAGTPAPALDGPSVEVASPGPSRLTTWVSLLKGRAKPPAGPVRPGLHPSGDPALWDVQNSLRALNYYTRGKPDGLNGPMTRDAVAAARKDNDLGDGGIDAAFLAALPGMSQRPVSVSRLTMPVTEAAKQRPEVFNPVKWMMGLGLGSISVGSVDGSGLLDKVNDTTGKANDVLGSVQGAIGTVTGVLGFVAEHKSWFLIGLGLYVVYRAAMIGLDAWIKVRKAFF